MIRLWTLLLTLTASFSAGAEFLVVGVEAFNYLPIYRGDDKNYTGFARDLLDDFAEKNGHTLEYRQFPILRLHDELLRRQTIDLKFPDNPHWNIEMRKGVSVAYSRPVLQVVEGLFVLPARRDMDLSTLKTIGAMRGFTPWPYMDGIRKKKIEYKELDSFEVLVKMCQLGRVDAVYVNTLVMNYYLAHIRKEPELLVMARNLPTDNPDFMLSSVRNSKIVTQFDEYLIREKARINKLKARYGIPK